MIKLNIFSVPIILIISYLTGNVSARLFETTFKYKDNNLESIAYYIKSCPNIAAASGAGRKVILRIDDVQAHTWRDVSEQMIYDANKQGMRTVLGIIPKNLDDDGQLLNFLQKNSCNVEIALHGWEHQVNGDVNKPEFGDLSQKEALEKIKKGLKVLRKITNKKITTFLPPQNKVSDDSRIALQQEGFKVISAEGTGKYDFQASTFDWISKKQVGVDEIMKQCQIKFAWNQPCVIMLHPQDYATDEKLDKQKYSQYLELLAKLKNNDISAVTFQDL
jgi:predicted deacetylase